MRNEAGNVVGLMPHPEHAIDALTGPGTDGLGFFSSVLRAMAARGERPRWTPCARPRAATPGQPQPYAELGLTATSTSGSGDLLGRRPTDAELAIYSVMWSEHCSYKSSKVHLRRFAEPRRQPRALLAGIGRERRRRGHRPGLRGHLQDRVAQPPVLRRAVQGAATGVGGIVRDILAMGARPVAVMDSLRFGPADAPDTAPGAARGGGGHLVLRQLPGPAQHRR